MNSYCPGHRMTTLHSGHLSITHSFKPAHDVTLKHEPTKQRQQPKCGISFECHATVDNVMVSSPIPLCERASCVHSKYVQSKNSIAVIGGAIPHLVLFDALWHHVQDVMHDSSTKLKIIVRLDALLCDSACNALGLPPLKLPSQQVAQPALEQRDNASQEEEPYAPHRGPETHTGAFANGTSVESIVHKVFQILAHADLPHQTVLVPVHTCMQQTHMPHDPVHCFFLSYGLEVPVHCPQLLAEPCCAVAHAINVTNNQTNTQICIVVFRYIMIWAFFSSHSST